MAESNSTDATSVYRYYDRMGLLLYVGVTARTTSRNVEHNRSKDWWRFVRSQKVGHYSTRAAALDAERELIRAFHPPFNVQHNADHRVVRDTYERWAASSGEQVDLDGLIHDHGKHIAMTCVSDRDGQAAAYLPAPEFAQLTAALRPRPLRMRFEGMAFHLIFPRRTPFVVTGPCEVPGLGLRVKIRQADPSLDLEAFQLGVR